MSQAATARALQSRGPGSSAALLPLSSSTVSHLASAWAQLGTLHLTACFRKMGACALALAPLRQLRKLHLQQQKQHRSSRAGQPPPQPAEVRLLQLPSCVTQLVLSGPIRVLREKSSRACRQAGLSRRGGGRTSGTQGTGAGSSAAAAASAAASAGAAGARPNCSAAPCWQILQLGMVELQEAGQGGRAAVGTGGAGQQGPAGEQQQQQLPMINHYPYNPNDPAMAMQQLLMRQRARQQQQQQQATAQQQQQQQQQRGALPVFLEAGAAGLHSVNLGACSSLPLLAPAEAGQQHCLASVIRLALW
jgi:hypothetical protein